MKFKYIGSHPMRILTIALILLLGACSGKEQAVSNSHSEKPLVPHAASLPIELVLQEGARLEASTTDSRITVIAGNKLKRRYEWGNCGLDADMIPRQERWFGSLGMYDPAGRLFIDPSAGCNGISRPVVEEGQIHFSDERSALAWISKYKRTGSFKTVWTNDGLLVQWGLSPQRSQINVDLWQICIGGKKPASLEGALDQNIKVSHPSGPVVARRECIDVPEKVIIETQKQWHDNWHQAGME